MGAARRLLVPLVGLAAIAVVAGGLLHRFATDHSFLPPDDFLQYWAAGRLLRDGGNPYDADQLFAVQAAAGRPDDRPVLTWNPPWALPLVAPAGLLPWRAGQLLWLALQLGLVAGSVWWLWGLAGGPPAGRPVAAAASLTFFPVGYLLHEGQCSGWTVLGLTGLLAAGAGGRPWLAALGAAAAVKPHLVLPVWVALALDACVSRRSRAMLAWGTAAGLVLAAAPWLIDGAVWAEYLAALRRPASATHTPLSGWWCPTVGWWVRRAVDPAAFWVQAVPAAVAVAGTAAYWRARRGGWDWGVELPRLVLLGLLASPYGAWPYDLVALLVPATGAAVAVVRRAGRRAQVVAGVGYAAFVIAGNLTDAAHHFVWVTPAVVAGYWLVDRRYGAGFGRPGGG